MQPTHTTAAAAGGFSAALVVVLVWLIESAGRCVIPGDVKVAMVAVIAPAVHIAAVKVAQWLGTPVSA